MNCINDIDTKFFLFLNGIHNDFFDDFFYIITKTVTWIPLYVILILLFVFSQKNKRLLKTLVFLLGVALLVAATDMVSARFFKPFFARLRPCQEPALDGLVHIVRGHCGGLYGFISSHAANLFGIATYSHIMLKDKYRYTWLLFLWAALIGYSRIYLGVHYPGDVICGALVGAAFGYILGKTAHKTCSRL